MKFVDEYRDAELVRQYAERIRKLTTRAWNIMEICGGQTHTIVRYGIEQLLPDHITLLHGPGCPVCVTPIETIDRAIALAAMPNNILATYGDLLRVPGSSRDLFSTKASGGDVRVVFSPMDAVKLASDNRNKRVVFLAVGFETTAPANAMAVRQAKEIGLRNFSVLSSHALVPPAMEAMLDSSDCRIQGFLAAGHVCSVMGYEEYIPIARKYHIPIVVTGFEPVDILQGILMLVSQLEAGTCCVENQYSRAVRSGGNPSARKLMTEVYEIVARDWRGIGTIPASGLQLRDEFSGYDAERIFDGLPRSQSNNGLCLAGEVLQGKRKPFECPAFGVQCTPEKPLGAPMVSTEGVCAAYFRYASAGLEKGSVRAYAKTIDI